MMLLFMFQSEDIWSSSSQENEPAPFATSSLARVCGRAWNNNLLSRHLGATGSKYRFWLEFVSLLSVRYAKLVGSRGKFICRPEILVVAMRFERTKSRLE